MPFDNNMKVVCDREAYIFDNYLANEDMLLHQYRRFNNSIPEKLETAPSLLQEDFPVILQRQRTKKLLQEGLTVTEVFTQHLQSDDVEDHEDDHGASPSSSSLPASSSGDGYAFVHTLLEDLDEDTAMPWPTIYQAAKREGYFPSITTWSSIKSGYYRWKRQRHQYFFRDYH